ncbi:hypothetical protein QE152_g36756 [Popillia japonica]|uniref:Uncharacterized protein n=1 Tax=Popillia japonica TaxID=7064 RepID=A0AAW1ICS8_POPJA
MQSAEGRALETDRQGTHARLGEKGECRCSNAEMEFWSCIRTLISGIRDELVARVKWTRMRNLIGYYTSYTLRGYDYNVIDYNNV